MITEAIKAEIVRCYTQGEPIAAIAAGFGVGIGYPAKLMKRRGLPLRRPEISRALVCKRSAQPWKPEPDAPRTTATASDIRSRLLAGEPLVLVAADFDLGLAELIAAARTPA